MEVKVNSVYADIIPVYQDGNRFYNDKTNRLLFISDVKVPDFDMIAALDAKEDFIKWAIENNVEWTFV